MSAINVTSVQVLDNPQFFASPLQFEIQYECLQDLRHGARDARDSWKNLNLARATTGRVGGEKGEGGGRGGVNAD